MRRQCAVASMVVLLAVAAGCKKRPPPARKAAAASAKPTITCPSHAELARALGAASGAVLTDCLVFPDSLFWMAGALLPAPAPGGSPRLALISGSPYAPPLLYDVTPAPTEALQQLISRSAHLTVKMRNGRRERRLVRLGVVGQPKQGAPDSDEVAVLLRLGAHAPPDLVWMGDGDQVHSAPAGCVVTRTVDFELLFGTRLEMFTSESSRGPATCPHGGDMQETVTARPVRLPPARPAATPDAGATP